MSEIKHNDLVRLRNKLKELHKGYTTQVEDYLRTVTRQMLDKEFQNILEDSYVEVVKLNEQLHTEFNKLPSTFKSEKQDKKPGRPSKSAKPI